MAAPTKEQREKRKKIEEVLKRDNLTYTELENHLQTDKQLLQDILTTHCEIRADEKISKIFYEQIIQKGDYVDPLLFQKEMGELPFFEGSVYLLLEFLSQEYDENLYYEAEEDRWEMHEGKAMNLIRKFSQGNNREWAYNDTFLRHLFNMPILASPLDRGRSYKNALVKIDFTKSKEEIVTFVSELKDNFDKNEFTVLSLDQWLGIDMTEDIKDAMDEVFTTYQSKPLSGKLADILFIYDCYKMGLTKGYVMNEIDRYWNDIKDFFKDKITAETHSKYLKQAKYLIEEKGYTRYLSGAK